MNSARSKSVKSSSRSTTKASSQPSQVKRMNVPASTSSRYSGRRPTLALSMSTTWQSAAHAGQGTISTPKVDMRQCPTVIDGGGGGTVVVDGGGVLGGVGAGVPAMMPVSVLRSSSVKNAAGSLLPTAAGSVPPEYFCV